MRWSLKRCRRSDLFGVKWSKNLVSHNPEILLYLSSRLKTGAPEPFQTVEELGLDSAAVSKEPEGWSVSLSAVLKVGLAAGAVLAGYYFYSTGMLTRVLSALQERGKAPDSELASLSNEFQYSAAIDQRLLHEVALTPNVVPLLVKGKADLWKRASDDSESCLLRVASSVAGKPGNEFVDDETFVALFRSGLETHSQSPNYMTADDATYAMNDLLTQGRVGVFEKLGGADVEKLLQRITPQNRLLLWTASKDHPKISEILEKAGAYLPLVEEFETSETLSEILIEWMMKDERLIHKLVECKADLLKTGPDRNPLLVEYVRYNPFPRWDTYHLMKDSAQWASDIEEKVRAAAYRTKKFDFLNKLF